MSVYDTLSADPAALMNPDAQRAVFDSINHNYSADDVDDVLYFKNAESIAKERDRVFREKAEQMAAAGKAKRMNNGEYLDQNNRTIYKDGMFENAYRDEFDDYSRAKKLGFDRKSYQVANEFLAADGQLKNIRAKQEQFRRVGLADQADALEAERVALEAENSRRIAALGANAGKLGALAEGRKTKFQQFLSGSGISKALDWYHRKMYPEEDGLNQIDLSSPGEEAVKPLDSFGGMPLEKRGVWENFKETFRKENTPLFGSAFGAKDNATLIQAAKRLELGEDYYRALLKKHMPGAPEEQIKIQARNAMRNDRDRVTAWHNAELEHERRGDTWLGGAAKGVGDSSAFALDLLASSLLTGGAGGLLKLGGLTKSAMKEAMKSGGKAALEKMMKKDFLKQTLKTMGMQQIHWFPQTMSSGVAGGLERYANDAVDVDHEGNVRFDHGVSAGEELGSGLADSAIENLSESSGELMGALVPRAMSKWSGRLARKLPRALSAGSKRLERSLQRLSGFNGVLGEEAEEWVGHALRGTIGLNSNKDIVERVHQELPTASQLAQEFLTFGVIQGGQRLSVNAANALAERWRKRLAAETVRAAIEQRDVQAEQQENADGVGQEQTEQKPAADVTWKPEAEAGDEARADRVQWIPVSSLNIDPERFQFKSKADKVSGVDESNRIGGKFDHKTAGNLLVWEDRDGKRFVVNGHHRFRLAKDSGVENVNAIIEREADGVTAEEARKHGVLTNIRDEQGDIQDYAEFVRSENMDEATAEAEGLLSRNKGRKGFLIGKYASDNLFSQVRDGSFPTGPAAVIADVSRGDEALEAAGIRSAKTMSEIQLREFLRLLKNTPHESNAESDLFGFDDSAIRKAEQLSRLAANHIRETGERVRVAKNAVRNPEAAGKMDVTVGRNAQKMLEAAQLEQKRWENWHTDPELYRHLEEELARKEGKAASAGAVDDPLNRALQEKLGKAVSVRAAEPANRGQKAVRDFFRKEFDTDIEFFDSDDLKADGFQHGGKIYLNRSGQKPMMVSAFHEFTHQLRVDSPEEFRELLSAVTSLSGKTELAEWKKNYNEKYRAAGYSGLEDGALEEEFIADVVGGMGGNAEFLKRLAGKNGSVLQRFLDWIRHLRTQLAEKGYGEDVRRVVGKQLDNVAREVEFVLRKRMTANRTPGAETAAEAESKAEADGADKAGPEQTEVLTSGFVARYMKRFGNILSSDNVKLMFRDRGYDPHDEESIRAFHKQTGPLVGKMFDVFMRKLKGRGNGTVVFTGGGNGAGKSTVLNGDVSRNADFVMDSAMVNLSAARDSIQKVIDNGQVPVLAFVYRSPEDAWFNGVQKRNQSADGHTVPKSTFANTHSMARGNFLKLLDEFGNKAQYIIWDNSSNGEKISLDELKAKPVYTKEQILEIINGKADSDEKGTGGVRESSQRRGDALIASSRGEGSPGRPEDRKVEDGGSQRDTEAKSDRVSGRGDGRKPVTETLEKKPSGVDFSGSKIYKSDGFLWNRVRMAEKDGDLYVHFSGSHEKGRYLRIADYANTTPADILRTLPDQGRHFEDALHDFYAERGLQLGYAANISRTGTNDRQSAAELTLEGILTSDKDNSGKKMLLKRYAFDHKITLKEAEEQLEFLVVQRARAIAQDNSLTEREKFNLIRNLYERMPLLNSRTSTSMLNQAYSTPVPLAYMLGRAIGLQNAERVYEPTAGNGALTIVAKPSAVTVNEIDKTRLAALNESGFHAVTANDATQYVPEEKQDAVIANPPFGKLDKQVEVDGYRISKLEHLISLKALESLKENGRAALILGAADKLAPRVNSSEKPFLNYLYDHFNIADSFEASGGLYRKQGASYPIRVIILDGRKAKSDLSEEFSQKPVDRLENWNDIYKRLETVERAIHNKQQEGTEDETGRRRLDDEVRGEIGKPGDVSDVAGAGIAEDVPGSGGKTDLDNQRTGGTVYRGQRTGTDEASDGVGAGALSGTSARGVEVQHSMGGGSGAADKSVERAERSGGTSGTAGKDGSGRTGGSGPVRSDRGPDAVKEKPERSKKPETAEVSEDGLQNRYNPKSAAESLGTMVPKFMRDETEKALSRLEKKYGPVDEFVRSELGYPSKEDMYGGLSAEQIDSVALAIDNIRNGESIIIGDQTGIGKGRQAAAVMRYAKRNGILPVFITEKPNLFSDLYGDGLAIGEQFRPLLIGNPGESSIVNHKNEVIYDALPPKKQKSAFEKLSNGEHGNFDSVFINYSQLNKSGNEQQRHLVNLVNRNDVLLVMDEAHNASGSESNTGLFFQSLIQSERLKGAVFLSATYAKRPDNMVLFSLRNKLGKVFSREQIVRVIKDGGLALQQVISRGLAEAGQLIRRERDFSGVKMNMGNPIKTPADVKRQYDEVAGVMSEFVNLSDVLEETFKSEGKKAGRKVDSSMKVNHFSSVVHNYVGQLLFATKLDTAADQIIAAYKAGQKPVIALSNTLESFLNEYAQKNALEAGDRIDVTFRDILLNALERMKVGRMTDRGGKPMDVPLTLKGESLALYDHLRERINELDLALPASPIDYLKAKLTAAGMRVGELTGRSMIINYDANGENGVLAERDKNGRNKTVNDFNSGALDAVILNRSGSTGLSLHSSEKFADRKQRHMFIVQADLDINIVMQTLGRVMRSGQVNKPEYTFLSTDLEAERRVMSILQKKFASLSANTTANTRGSMSFGGTDLLNKYGDRVVAEYLTENPVIAGRVGLKVELNSNGRIKPKEDLARSFTGKMALLPNAMQKRIYQDLDELYEEYVSRLKSIGEYDLEITEQEWNAEEVKSEQYGGGEENGSIFDKPLKLKTFRTREKRRVPDRAALNADRKQQFGGTDIDVMRDSLRRKFKEQKEKAEAFFEEQMADAENKNEVRNRKAAALTNLEKAENRALNLLGYPVQISSGEEAFRGTLSYVKFNRTGNPGAESNIKFSFLTESPLRMTVPLSQLGTKPGQIAVNHISDSLDEIFTDSPNRTVEMERRVYVGNLLRGVDAAEGNGKIVKFTLADGGTETGVVLPSAFSMSSLKRDPRRKLGSLEEIERYLNAGGRRTYATGDYGLALSKDWIATDAKRSSGGKIFMDEDILKITGDFRRIGNVMRAYINEDQFRKVVPLLLEKTQISGDLELMNKLRENSGDVKLDIQDGTSHVTRTFNAELERQIRGELPSDHIYQLGRPSDILLRTGIPDLNIELSASRLKQKAESENHPFSIGDIRNLPNALRNPIAIFAYGDSRKAQNIIVDIQNNGNDFLVGLTLNYNHDGINVNSIRGLFPKDTANWLNWIQQGKALYLDKERVQNRIAQQRTNSADVSYPDLNSIENIVRNFRNVKGNSEEISLSIQDPDISGAVRKGLRWLSDLSGFRKKEDENGKTDISKLSVLFGTVMYYSKKIPAFKKIYDYAQRFEEDAFRLKEQVFGEEEKDLKRVTELQKNKAEYAKFRRYIFQKDLDAAGFYVRRNSKKEGDFEILDPNGAVVGHSHDENSAWESAWNKEAEMLMRNGESREFADAVLAYRQMNARVYNMLKYRADALKAEYEENDIPFDAEITDLFEELRKMGDRRGYYMPRIRAGKYILEAEKDGVNPRVEIFDTKTGRAARAATLKGQGYQIHFRQTATPSNAVFEDMSLAGMNDVFTSAFERASEAAKKDYRGFGLDAGWIDYQRKDGSKERHFVIRGRTLPEQVRLFKEFGGGFWKDLKEWRFPAPKCGADIDRVLLDALNAGSAENKALVALGNALASQVSILIHSHGSRSRKIRRDDRKGKDVYLGYEEDPVRALVMSASAVASGTAKSVMAKNMMEAFTGRDLKWRDFKAEHMPEGVEPGSRDYHAALARVHREYEREIDKRRIDSAKQPEAYRDGKDYIREMLRNQESSERITGFIRGVAALKYLSRISIGLVNLGTLVTNVPAVFHAEGKTGFADTLKQLGVTASRYGNYLLYRKYGKGKRPPMEDVWLFGEIERRGWDSSLVNREATGVLRTWFGKKWQWIAEKMMFSMELTERFNRAVTIAAGYRLLAARNGGPLSGQEKAALLDQAKEMSDKAHGVYGKTNLPSWARGASAGAQALRAFYVFKPYGHNYMQELYELGVNQKDRKAFAWMLLSPMILAGPTATVAWNLMPVAVRAVCAVFGIEPPDDPEEALYRWVEDEFGGYASRVARYGAGGAVGINLAPSMSMMFTKDSIPQTVWDLFGAPGSAVKDLAEGAGSVARGDVLKGLEKISPAMLSAPLKAIREYSEGVTLGNGQPVFYGNRPLHATGPQSLLRMVGFNPAGLSEKREKQWAERMTAREYSNARTEIYSRLRRYYRNPYRGADDYAELIGMIREYNARVRRNRPHGVTLITSRQLRALRRRLVTPPRAERMRKENGW